MACADSVILLVGLLNVGFADLLPTGQMCVWVGVCVKTALKLGHFKI